MVDRLFGESEITPRPPAHLHDHQGGRRARVDRHEIELVSADVDVPGKDRPAGVDQPLGDERLGGVARLLRRRPGSTDALASHGPIVAGAPHPPINRASPGGSSGLHRRLRGRELQEVKVGEVEGRVVGHDGQQLALEQLVRRR